MPIEGAIQLRSHSIPLNNKVCRCCYSPGMLPFQTAAPRPHLWCQRTASGSTPAVARWVWAGRLSMTTPCRVSRPRWMYGNRCTRVAWITSLNHLLSPGISVKTNIKYLALYALSEDRLSMTTPCRVSCPRWRCGNRCTLGAWITSLNYPLFHRISVKTNIKYLALYVLSEDRLSMTTPCRVSCPRWRYGNRCTRVAWITSLNHLLSPGISVKKRINIYLSLNTLGVKIRLSTTKLCRVSHPRCMEVRK